MSTSTKNSTELITTLITVRDYLRWASSEFTRARLHFGHGTDNAWDEAVVLLRHVLQIPEEAGNAVLDARLLMSERRELIEVFQRRIQDRLPAAYLTGTAWFAGLPFNVDRRVIVPRSPMAEMIENGFEPWLNGLEIGRILDLCTGSGCIGIAAALAFPQALVDLADLSADALAVANTNIELHQLTERIYTIESDLFANLSSAVRYDLIISNPPYVDSADIAAMPAEFLQEPALALASGEDGLDITRRILAQAGEFLAEDGLLVVEVGNSGRALEAAYPDFPFVWVEFARGGDGVFVMRAAELQSWKQAYAS